MFSTEQIELAEKVIQNCISHKMMIATAESCTGGLISACLTEIPGASGAVDRSFVTYHDNAKRDLLGVPEKKLIRFGAVSKEVAIAMAEGALVHSMASVAVSCSGIAGPRGGTAEKPVGSVHIACAFLDAPTLHIARKYGAIGRSNIRTKTLNDALTLVLQLFEKQLDQK